MSSNFNTQSLFSFWQAQDMKKGLIVYNTDYFQSLDRRSNEFTWENDENKKQLQINTGSTRKL